MVFFLFLTFTILFPVCKFRLMISASVDVSSGRLRVDAHWRSYRILSIVMELFDKTIYIFGKTKPLRSSEKGKKKSSFTPLVKALYSLKPRLFVTIIGNSDVMESALINGCGYLAAKLSEGL